MNLSSDLISQFVKVTNDNKDSKNETVIYGTIVKQSNTLYVRPDWSDQIIPISKYEVNDEGKIETITYVNNSAADLREAKDGDRVTIMIKNHVATVTGNLSSPAASTNDSRLVIGEEVHDKVSRIEVDNVKINERLDASEANVGKVVADNVIIREQLTAEQGVINELKAKDVEITERLSAAEADIETLTSESINTEYLEANYAKIENLNVTNEKVYNLDATFAAFRQATGERLDTNEANIVKLEAKTANIGTLEADVAKIDDLIFNGASGDTIHTNFANSVVALLGDAWIKSAMIDTVSASKIKAGTLSTNEVVIASDDGSMTIQDGTIQFSDSDTVRVQIGKDRSGNYSIIVCDAEGNAMLTADGLTEDSIKDAIIRNDMVSPTANIDASKLNIDTLFEVINDSSKTISSTRVQLDNENQTLDVAFDMLTTSVDELQNDVDSQSTQISAIQGEIKTLVSQQAFDDATETMSTQYSELRQEVDGVSATVSSHTTQISNKADQSTVNTVSNKVSALETNLSGFKSTVSDTYVTKTALQTDLDNIEIGGRNLVLASNVETTVSNSMGKYELSTYGKSVLTESKSVAISFDAYAELDTTLDCYVRGNASISTMPVHSIGTEKTRYTCVVTVTGSDPQTITFRGNTSVPGYVHTKIYISNVKAELGTKSTDWLLAPEDVETRIATAETAIEQNASDILLRAKTSDVNTIANNLNTNFYTKSQTEAQIKLASDSIESSVANSFSDITSRLDNQQIGGRNLVLDSEKEVSFVNTVKSFDLTEYGIANLKNTQAVVSFDLRTDTPGAGCDYYLRYINESGGGTAIGTTPIDGVSDTYTRYSAVITTADIAPTMFAIRTTSNTTGSNPNSSATFFVKNIKVELGNMPTDWTPAPEDTENEITNLSSRITSAESSVTQLSNKISANVTETTNLGTRVSTVEQTASGLTTRISNTETTASNAAKTATNYLSYSSSGLIVGDMTASTLGKNVRISSSTVDIRNGTTTLASFGADTIYLGKNSETAVINLCNGSATMRSVDDSDFKIYTDKRLVMSAYSSMLLDCWRDSTHMTRVSLQSADPDATYMWGGISCTIYQDTIENTFDMSGNTTELKILKGNQETLVSMNESRVKITSTGTIEMDSANGLVVGGDGSYASSVTLGYKSTQAKSVRWYWSDNALHDAFSNSNGQITYVGPGDISETTTTMVRGQYVRLYAHSGGAVYLGYSGSTAVTSDRNLKSDIFDVNDKYLDFFDRLRPITYKYDCPDHKGHRDHIGFVAQEVEEALIESGLTTEQFAGLIIENDVTLNPNYDSSLSDEENAANGTHYDTLYSLRYEEFISLLVKKVQSLQEQINTIRANM